MHWLLTRPAGLNLPLQQALEARGHEVSVMPALAIESWSDGAQQALWQELEQMDVLLFTSRNAVTRFAEQVHARQLDWPAVTHLAIGRATAHELQAHGRDALSPAAGYTSESLLALPALAGFAGKRLLLVTGVGGRGLLLPALQQRGIRVARLDVYRRCCDTSARWPTQPVTGVMVTSLESWHCIREKAAGRLAGCVVVAGNARIAREIGGMAAETRVAASPNDEDMLACALQARAGETRS